MIKGIVGGLIGGAIGAAIWAAIAYFAHVQVGIVAIGVGALVGGGTFMFAGDAASPVTGAIAVVIALLSIAAGKYITIHAIASNYKSEVHKAIVVDENIALVHISEQLAKEAESGGKKLAWPKGMNVEEASEESEFPPEIWADSKSRWAAMTPTQQEGYKRDLQESLHSELDGVVAEAEAEAFTKSFDFFDVLWAFLAIGAAFKLGSGNMEGGGGD